MYPRTRRVVAERYGRGTEPVDHIHLEHLAHEQEEWIFRRAQVSRSHGLRVVVADPLLVFRKLLPRERRSALPAHGSRAPIVFFQEEDQLASRARRGQVLAAAGAVCGIIIRAGVVDVCVKRSRNPGSERVPNASHLVQLVFGRRVIGLAGEKVCIAKNPHSELYIHDQMRTVKRLIILVAGRVA